MTSLCSTKGVYQVDELTVSDFENRLHAWEVEEIIDSLGISEQSMLKT